jgi:hypothetical protein
MRETRTDDAANESPTIPDELAQLLQRAFRLEHRPETLRGWGEAMGTIVEREGLEIGLQTLCTTEHSPHKARFNGRTQHFVCVQDAFIVPYVTEDVETVEITTESPVTHEVIEATVTGDDVTIDPPEAVMSFGIADEVPDPDADAHSPELAYGLLCPYGHAFRDRAEYDSWAETVDAVTTVAPLTDALDLAKGIGAATG